MNIADILLWEATNGLLLIPVWIALVMLTRWMRGQPVFTERDWFFLIGHPREKVLAVHFWLRFATLWFAMVLVGFAEGYVLWPLVSHRSLERGFSLRLWFGESRRSGYANEWADSPLSLSAWLSGSPQQTIQFPNRIKLPGIVVTADGLGVDKDLRHRSPAGKSLHFGSTI